MRNHDKIYRYISNFVIRIYTGSTPTFYNVLRSPSLMGGMYHTIPFGEPNIREKVGMRRLV